ncbi:ABC transporter permease [Nocardia beijingensis]|uniref:ABC transporter permease n=1 Tax=Nocardia beijingensis TaxID=95162 RepID=UPI001893056E|nr:ABC transporter permease [Nocardia beijingensis]MBF6468645.1 ABC transporter permease [Nocardia beijingensis]
MRFARECFIVYRRQMRIMLRYPGWLLVTMSNPALYLVAYGPLLSPLADRIETTDTNAFFVPGMLVMQALFGATFAGFLVITELHDGVIEAERVTPASRTALLVGRILRVVTLVAAQALALIAIGYVMGMRPAFGGVLAGLTLVLLLAGALTAASCALGLTMKDANAMSPITQGLNMVLLLLSGIFLPMTIAPTWLQVIAGFVPTKHIVDAVRTCFDGSFDLAVIARGGTFAVVIMAAALWWGTRTFRKAAA